MRQPDEGPSAITWAIALISLGLPWAAALLCLAGGWQIAQGERAGWWLVATAGFLLVLDMLIDFVWANPSRTKSDLPDLNRRADQLIGRVLVLEEAIEGGRGKVRAGDTVWPVEGPDLPAGREVRVIAAKATLLVVVAALTR